MCVGSKDEKIQAISILKEKTQWLLKDGEANMIQHLGGLAHQVCEQKSASHRWPLLCGRTTENI